MVKNGNKVFAGYSIGMLKNKKCDYKSNIIP